MQVLGVEREVGSFFTVDSASEIGTAVVVIGKGRNSVLVLKDTLSDHNGVACLTSGQRKFLLIWSNCAGSACGDNFTFTVVDALAVRVVAGKSGDCDEQCASRLTGSRLPLKLNSRRN